MYLILNSKICILLYLLTFMSQLINQRECESLLFNEWTLKATSIKGGKGVIFKTLKNYLIGSVAVAAGVLSMCGKLPDGRHAPPTPLQARVSRRVYGL